MLEPAQLQGLSLELTNEVTPLLETYLSLQAAIKDLERQAAGLKAEISEAFYDAGEAAALVDGVGIASGRVKMVYPNDRRELDTKLLLRQGVTLTQIEAAKVSKPVKAYLKISPPGKEKGESQ